MFLLQLKGVSSQSFDIVFQIAIVGILAHDNGFFSFIINVYDLCKSVLVLVEGQKIGRYFSGFINFDTNKSIL